MKLWQRIWSSMGETHSKDEKITSIYPTSISLIGAANIQLQKDSILIVVGPNNSGKSTFLREIRGSLEDSTRERVVISKVEFAALTPANVRRHIELSFRIRKEAGSEFYSIAADRRVYLSSVDRLPDSCELGEAAGAIISLLNAEGRLRLSADVQTVDILSSESVSNLMRNELFGE